MDALLFGTPIIIAWEHDLGDNRRKHKKKRINKKWRKRYGAYNTGLRPLAVRIIDGKIYMSRRTYTILKSKSFSVHFMKIPHHGNNTIY